MKLVVCKCDTPFIAHKKSDMCVVCMGKILKPEDKKKGWAVH